MGRKVHPFGYRVGVIYDWRTHWFAKSSDYNKFLVEDIKLRKEIDKLGKEVCISKVIINRRGNELRIRIFTSRPGILIGKRGSNIEQLKKRFEKIVEKSQIKLEVIEVNSPDLSAKLVSEGVAMQIEHRVAFKRAMKQAIFRTMKAGSNGIKVMVSGRLNGADIARTEWFREGRIPLHTIRAKIDYHETVANTKFGCVGVKVWIYSGDQPTDPSSLPTLYAEYGG
jgi:small subunit ribosomal protein S3